MIGVLALIWPATRGFCNIAQGLEQCLYMGNMDAARDFIICTAAALGIVVKF